MKATEETTETEIDEMQKETKDKEFREWYSNYAEELGFQLYGYEYLHNPDQFHS